MFYSEERSRVRNENRTRNLIAGEVDWPLRYAHLDAQQRLLLKLDLNMSCTYTISIINIGECSNLVCMLRI